jgi:hypothetical protein
LATNVPIGNNNMLIDYHVAANVRSFLNMIHRKANDNNNLTWEDAFYLLFISLLAPQRI